MRFCATTRRWKSRRGCASGWQKEDPNAVIGQCGEDGSSEICAETLKMFVSAFGAEAGNVALKVLAAGGMYLGGGIAPKILKTMQNGEFAQAFLDKGRMSPLLEAMPVRIILDDTCALLGRRRMRRRGRRRFLGGRSGLRRRNKSA